MQVLHNEVIFKKALCLFNEKWKDQSDDINQFLAHFETNTCSDLAYGWYEGHVEGIPSTSNALEGTHKHIKLEPLLKTKKPLRHFLGNLYFNYFK